MKKRKTDLKAYWLVGQWRVREGYLGALFTVAKTASGFHVKGLDESENEELAISNVRWNGSVLSFETLTTSNGWRTKNRLEPISRTEALHEITYWEPWEKILTKRSPKKAVPATRARK